MVDLGLTVIILLLFALSVLIPAAGVAAIVAARRDPLTADHENLGCGKCGYDTRAISTFQCPECGSDLREVGIFSQAIRWERPGRIVGAITLGVCSAILVMALWFGVGYLFAW